MDSFSLNGQEKESLKELVDKGRLEVVTGGWVMTDEASPSLYAMLDQLIEGNFHQFHFLHTFLAFLQERLVYLWMSEQVIGG